MKKTVLFIFIFLVNYSLCHSEIFETKNPEKVLSLKTQVINRLFNFNKYPDQKRITNEKLKRKEINLSELRFEGLTLKNLDFSGMYLRDIDFSGCTFENVKLKDADLSDTQFDQAILKNSEDLEGAIIYCPLDNMDQQLNNRGF